MMFNRALVHNISTLIEDLKMFALAQGQAFDAWRTSGKDFDEHEQKVCDCIQAPEIMVLCDDDNDGGEVIEPVTRKVYQNYECKICERLEQRYTGEII